MDTWGMLNTWLAFHPGTFSTHVSQVFGFALLTLTALFVGMKFLRRPEKNDKL